MQVGGDGVAFGFQDAEFVTAAHQDSGHALCFDNERRHGGLVRLENRVHHADDGSDASNGDHDLNDYVGD